MSEPPPEPPPQEPKAEGKALPAPSQEQIDALMRVIDRVERKRKLMLTGYLVALVLLVGGQITALWVFSRTPPGTFIGWIFLVPFGLVGVVVWLFGWLSGRKPRQGP